MIAHDKFQFLIGTPKTERNWYFCCFTSSQSKPKNQTINFRSSFNLIGTLKTSRSKTMMLMEFNSYNKTRIPIPPFSSMSLFQFLIGTPKTPTLGPYPRKKEKVSIPHRYAKNIRVSGILEKSLKLQFLIGTLKTEASASSAGTVNESNSPHTGTLKQGIQSRLLCPPGFSILIGTLKTMYLLEWDWEQTGLVSLPHRYAKNIEGAGRYCRSAGKGEVSKPHRYAKNGNR